MTARPIIDRFRRLCGQFRWLAVFMVVSVGPVLALMYVIAPPLIVWLREGREPTTARAYLPGLVWVRPIALLSVRRLVDRIGHGPAGSKGRLIQPTLACCPAARRSGAGARRAC